MSLERQSVLQLREFPGYANRSHPLHRAAARGDTAFLRTLAGVLDLRKIRMRDRLGATPLHVAAREGRRECLQWLLENTGLSVSDRAAAGETPLHVAAARGHAGALQLLARHAAPESPEERARLLLAPDSNQLTALHLAALKGHQPVVNWIVMEYKSFLSPLMETGRVTPAHLAASAGQLEILRTLLASANRFNGWAEARDTEGTPVAYFAAQEGRLECVRFLLEELSADPRALCADGMSALHAAAQAGHDVIIRYYVERLGTEIIRWTTEDKGIPLHFAASLGHASTVSLLLGYDHTGTTHSFPDEKLVTPLHEALLTGRAECARILIEAGADVRAEDSAGRSPLSIVSQDTFHACRDVVMQAIRDSVSEHTDEEPVRHRIPKARSGYHDAQGQNPVIRESAVQEKHESLYSNESKVLSSHSSETTPLPSSASEVRYVLPEQEGTPDRRKSLAELSYSLSLLLEDTPSPLPADKFLAGMDRRTARRQLRWLARSAPSLLAPPAVEPPEEQSPPEAAPPPEPPEPPELPRRQVSSLVLERMSLLGAAPRGAGSPAELRPVPEEPAHAGAETDLPYVRSGRDLPADMPVSEELRFFYGPDSKSLKSDSASTLLSPEPPAAEITTDQTAEVTADLSSQSAASSGDPSAPTEIDQSDLSFPGEPAEQTADFIEPGPALGAPIQELLSAGPQGAERPRKGRFSGLRLLGRLLGRREPEEGPGGGVSAFEAIMQRNLRIQEQIRSAPYPHLPPDILGPVATSTAARAPAWQPADPPSEQPSSASPAPPTSSTSSLPAAALLIRSETRPVSAAIAIETAVPHALTGAPASSFTARPQPEPLPVPAEPVLVMAAPAHNPETLLEGIRLSSRIANLTHSLLDSAAPVSRPYSPEMVYSKVPADRPKVLADRPKVPAEKPMVSADRPLLTADRPVISADRPLLTADRPLLTADRPLVSADRPLVSADRPVISADRPLLTADRPLLTADRPLVSADRPLVSADRPLVSADRPVISADRPLLTADRPLLTADRPLVSADRPLVSADRPLVSADRPVISADRPLLTADRPLVSADRPLVPADTPGSQPRGGTSSYDVPSWEEAREYLRRVTARQRGRQPEEEEPAGPAPGDQSPEAPEPEPEVKPEVTPELPRSPALPDLSAATREPLRDTRRKLAPGPGVSRLRERFSHAGAARPQNLRISALKRETLESPPMPIPVRPKPVPALAGRPERVPAPVRPVKSSRGVGKMPALSEEPPDAMQLLREMLLDRGDRGVNNRESTDPVAAPVSVPAEPDSPVGEAGRGSLRTEVQVLSGSGQVRDRLRLFS